MPNTLNMPSNSELVSLSDGELVKRIGLALHQLDKAEERGENTTEKTKIYQAYKNELAKRNYRQQAHR
jgi:hypothetical protein